MTTETAKMKSRLAALASSVDDLEELLEPLFAQSLPESIMPLEPIQQAKLQTVLPYLVYDLIFIYLKARGIDPRTHSVVSELDRVKQYFEKIMSAEKSGNKEPATKIDKEAAGRFIKHAIAQASKQVVPDEPTPPTTSSVPVPVPIKTTSKMKARAEYEQQLKEQDAQSTEEEELEVIDEMDDDDAMDIDKAMASTKLTLKHHTDKIATEDGAQVCKKRRRRPVDPFAGYGDDMSTSEPGVQSQPASHSVPKPQIDNDKVDSGYENSASSTPSSTSPSQRSNSKPQNKKRKKSKKPAI